MADPLRILIVEDFPADAQLLVRQLQRGGFAPQYTVVDNADDLRRALQSETWDVLVADYHLPSLDAFGALSILKESGHDIPFIIVSGTIDQETAVFAMKSGAHDYLMKDNLARLVPVIRREIQEAQTRARKRQAERELATLREELAIQLADITCLHQLGLRLSTTTELPQVVHEILDAVTSLQNTDAAAFLLCADHGPGFHLVEARGMDIVEIDPEGAATELARKAAEEKHPIFAALRGLPEGTVFGERALARGYSAAQSVPLMTRGGNLLGCIELYYRRPALTQREIRLMDSYCQQAGQVLDNVLLYKQMVEANRLKDEFVAMVSHELRTPLTPIMGAVHILRMCSDETMTTRAIEIIDRNVRVQTQMIEDLLDISRIVSGKLRLRLATVDLTDVISTAATQIRPLAESKKIDIQLDLHPPAGQVFGDKDRLQQVVWNLMSNAVKFTPEQGRVKVELVQTGNDAQIRVTDTGIGIATEFLPFVFERFRQADGSNTRAHGGLGLGLAIVQQIVHLHGGLVRAESAGTGCGACFIVQLPLRSQAESSERKLG